MKRLVFIFLFSILMNYATYLSAQGTVSEKWVHGIVKVMAMPQAKHKDTGTGFVVKIEHYIYIITAMHVVEGETKALVEFPVLKHKPFEANVKDTKITTTIKQIDGLALLVVETSRKQLSKLRRIKPLRLASFETKNPQQGDLIEVMGFPEATTGAFCSGNVYTTQPTISELQVSCREAAKPGSSGSPIRRNGLIIGMVTSEESPLLFGILHTDILEFLKDNDIVQEDRIVFESNRDGNWEIYDMEHDGDYQENLTNNENVDREPSVAHISGEITFASNRDGNWEIYKMNAVGSDLIPLTKNQALDKGPRWSPDGEKIAFASNRDGNWEIYVMDKDGGNQTRLTDNPAVDEEPSWSPDGEKIAFTSNRDSNWEIYKMNTDGEYQIRLTNDPAVDGRPSWSPDGKIIAFESKRDDNYEIYVMDKDGGNQTRLTNNLAVDRKPYWSLDGKELVFESNRYDNFKFEICKVEICKPKDEQSCKLDDIKKYLIPDCLTKKTADDRTPSW